MKGRISNPKSVREKLKEMNKVVGDHITIDEQDVIIKVSVPDLRSLEGFVI